MADERQKGLGIGGEFQRLTKYDRETMTGKTPRWEEQPPAYKSYPEAGQVRLPEPETAGGGPLWEVIGRRRSFREFKSKPVDLKTVSQLLWASQGLTGKVFDFELRAAPSAGALYPVETYLVSNLVESLEAGLYHYDIRDHALETVRKADLREELMHAGLMQPVLFECAAAFIWTAIVKRSRWKYRQRCYRYIYLDAGHIAQNLALAAEALDLGTCLIGALFDDEVNRLLGVDGTEETVLYMCAVGPR
ncbi:MAG: SagB/ThcOx family dehydrogenase [Candidatus Glassbacteria bacterium]|nr:SagB/ThcOx family dehydrogenase [Candidatus Glassbacteria bacterium]